MDDPWMIDPWEGENYQANLGELRGQSMSILSTILDIDFNLKGYAPCRRPPLSGCGLWGVGCAVLAGLACWAGLGWRCWQG